MSWFYERLEVPSVINGSVSCLRVLGTWQIAVGGTGQSGDYLDTLWKQAVRQVPQRKQVKRILILGLGIGSSLKAYRKRFPQAHIHVVEIDPVMIELTKRFGFLRNEERIQIFPGDAATVLPTLPTTYDLIVFDMFLGEHVAPVTRESPLIQAALAHLTRQGSILVNAYAEPDVFNAFNQVAHETKRWRYLRNHVALFRPWGAGNLGDPLPAGYQYAQSCEPYMEREFIHRAYFGLTKAGSVVGIRRHLLFFDFAHYLGDEEPKPLPFKTCPRLTFWQPLSRLDRPAGWMRSPVAGHRRLSGFAFIPASGDYVAAWSEHAKRHTKRWHKQTTHVIVEADAETYIAGYERSTKQRSLINLFSEEIRRKAQTHPGCLRLRVAKDLATDEMIAGFASLWIPEIQQTFHVTSFVTPAGRDTDAAFGLVDDCFQIAQQNGCRTLEFDGFWAPGDPSSWKGFSRFKDQFGVYYLRWPKPLIRFD